MFTARTAPGGRLRRLVAAATAAALGTTALVAVAATPATAVPTGGPVTSGSFDWGFKQSLRTYVGNGGSVTLVPPAAYDADAAGTASSRPYTFAVTPGASFDAARPAFATTGGVVLGYAAHGFEVELDDVRLEQGDSGAVLVADVVTTSTIAFGQYPAGTFGGPDVVLADVADVAVAATGTGVEVTGTGLTLTAEGAAAFPLYGPGEALDDFSATLALGASVSVSATELPDDLTSVVTVEGRGFDPALNIGARPPFAGRPAGVYVAFGRYDDVWRPSEGAASSTRRNPTGDNGNGTAVVWAVPAASFAGSGQSLDAPEYTELREDGTFTATLRVNRAWLADAPGTFGIYTYAGGGGKVAAYETATPVSFYARGAATVTPTWPSLSYGTTGALWVKVTGATPATGKVTLSEGSKVLASGTLSVSGKVKLAVPRTLGVGKHTLTVSYSGDDRLTARSVSSTRTVTKAASTTKATAAKVKVTARGKVVVTVTAAAKVTGTVKVVVKRNGSTKAAATATLVDGRRTVTLPTLPKGTYTVTATYNGSATVAKSSTSTTLVVY